MITYKGQQVSVTDADKKRGEATVRLPSGQYRLVSVGALTGTKGGAMEVAFTISRVSALSEQRASREDGAAR